MKAVLNNHRVLTVWLLLTPVICELFDCLSLIKGAGGFLGGSGGGFLGGSGGGCGEDACATILQSCQHNKYAYDCVKKKSKYKHSEKENGYSKVHKYNYIGTRWRLKRIGIISRC